MAKTNHIIQPIDVTYSQLVTLINSSGLTEGQEYRITDFQTVHYILDFIEPTLDINSGDVEPLIVKADSNNTINKRAYSQSYPLDIIYYDYNPSDWEDDPAFFGVSGFKGVIYYRHDTKQNVKAHYDFRNVKIRLWKINEETNQLPSDRYVSPYSTYEFWTYLSPFWNDYEPVFTTDPDDYQDFYTFGDYSLVSDVEICSPKNSLLNDNWEDEKYPSILPNIVFRMIVFSTNAWNTVTPYLKGVKIKSGFNNVLTGYMNNVEIGTSFESNIITHSLENIIIGNNFYYNAFTGFDDYSATIKMTNSTVGNYFTTNFFKQISLSNCNIGELFGYNTMINTSTIHARFFYNSNIGGNIQGNFFQNGLSDTNMGGEIDGNYFVGSTFGVMYSNFGSQIYGSTFMDPYYSEFGTEIYDSYFGSSNYSRFYGPIYESTFGDTYQCQFQNFINYCTFPSVWYLNFQGDVYNVDFTDGYGNIEYVGTNARPTIILDEFHYLDLDEINSEFRFENKDFTIQEDKKDTQIDGDEVSLAGYFYNKFAFTNANFPAVGWTVPSMANWETLTNYLTTTYAEINSTNVGNYLKVDRQPNHPSGGKHNTAIQPAWTYDPLNVPVDQFNFSAVPSGVLDLWALSVSDARFFGFGLGATSYNNGKYGLTRFATTTDRRFMLLRGKYGTVENIYVQHNHLNAHNQGYSVRLFRAATVDEQSLSDGSYVDNYVGNDGKSYKAVKIGTQVWVTENLRETQLRNGDPIPVQSDLSLWRDATTPYRISYRNREEYATTTDWRSDTIKFIHDKKIDVSNVKNALNTQIQIKDITLTSGNWYSGTTFWEYQLENENILENSIVDIIPSNLSISVVRQASILPEIVVPNSGSVIIYAENQPTDNFNVTLNIINSTKTINPS